MPTISALTTFTSNTQAKAAEVNANFSTIRTTVNTYCAFVDTSATISGAWTFTTAPTISGTMSFGAAVTITTGGLTINAGGFAVTGNSSVTGTLTATTFSGSGASLTNLPAANITGTLPAISGANLTSLNGSNISSGTVAAARLPDTYTSLTVTTQTSDVVQGVTAGNRAILNLAGSQSTFLAMSSGCSFLTASAPAGGVNQYLNVRIGTTDYRITLVPV